MLKIDPPHLLDNDPCSFTGPVDSSGHGWHYLTRDNLATPPQHPENLYGLLKGSLLSIAKRKNFARTRDGN
jgi:hypothetical protein